ncbi:MAG: hypothetical protein HND48_25215 [Chloroflexi bacterium]|nr:hypothetical protein [Chloroflexota bacterium]
MGGLGLVYGTLYTVNARSNGRYRAGVPIEHCPACGSAHLHVKAVRRRYLGVPVVRHRVTCEDCGSVLRESRPRAGGSIRSARTLIKRCTRGSTASCWTTRR